MKEIGELEGVSQMAYIAGADRYTHFHLLFYLQPSNERKVTQAQIMTEVRRVLARHPAFAASIVGRNPLGGGGNFGLQASLLGPDLKTLYEYSQKIVEKAKQTPSLVDAKSDYSDASPEVQVAVDRSRAADLGVRMATIGNTLRLMVAGDDEITTYREAGEQHPSRFACWRASAATSIWWASSRSPRSRASQSGSTTSRGWSGDSAHPHRPLEPAVFDQPERRHRARLRSSNRPDLAASPRRSCRRASFQMRGRRRTSTRPRTT